jgi:excisionase family DNA binding protein
LLALDAPEWWSVPPFKERRPSKLVSHLGHLRRQSLYAGCSVKIVVDDPGPTPSCEEDKVEQTKLSATDFDSVELRPHRQVWLVTLPAAAHLLGVSRSKLYELVAAGELPTVRIGRSRRVAVADLEEFVRRCRTVQ